MSMPTVSCAERFLIQAGKLNPGPWVEHNFYTGRAASLIAEKCRDMDSEKAYICGILHDIGRRNGKTHMRHSLDGYIFLSRQGYEEPARICLTHSFANKNADEIFGEWDCSVDEYNFIKKYIENIEYDDYDRLIQLCDNVALSNGFCILEKRMIDVQMRHGVNKYTVPKWKATFDLKDYFDKRTGSSIYTLLPGIVDTTFGVAADKMLEKLLYT